MEARFTPPIVCPVLVGRAAALGHLRARAAEARQGQAQVVLVSGEAGIGKSRLVAEAAAQAAAQGFRLLLHGQAFPTDSAVPYAPLLELVRAYLAASDAGAGASPLPAFVPTLVRLLPDLALERPDLAALPPPAARDPQEESRRLFAALTHFVTEAAAVQPVLLIVEDLHWADALSLDFLLHLARRSRHAPVLLFATYRSDDLPPALRQWLAQLDRERLAAEVTLDRLAPAEVAAMVRRILDLEQEADAELVDVLYAHSEGNPFFVEELLKGMIAAGTLTAAGVWTRSAQPAAIPRSVQEAVQQRTAALSPNAHRLVTLAAVAGRRFDVTLLQDVLGYDDAALLALLKEVAAAQLVIEEAADRFAFRHALTQQAIAAALLGRERRALHRRIAEALERRAAAAPRREPYLDDLAYHTFEAGLWDAALTYTRAAGERALSLYAQQAAITHLTRALDAADRLGQPAPAAMLLLRGQAYETLGEFEHARADFEQAREAAAAAQDRGTEWQSMMALGYLWTGRDYEQAGLWLRRALALAEDLDDPALRARSLNRLGNMLANTAREAAARQAHHAALRIFEESGDTRGMAETLDVLGTAYGLGGDRNSSDHYLGRAITLFEALRDEQARVMLLANRALQATSETAETVYQVLRAPAERLADAQDALRLGQETGWLSGQAFAMMALAYVRAADGAMGAALALAHEALQIATAIEHRQWTALAAHGLADFYLLLLQPEPARAALARGLPPALELGSEIWLPALATLQARAALLEEDPAGAAVALTPVLLPEQPPRTAPERQVAWAWGEVALAQGEPDRALARAEELLATIPGVPQPQPIPHLLRLKGEALAALGRPTAAVAALEEARRGAEMRGDPSVRWRIQHALAHVYHRQRRAEEARREQEAARTIISQLAAGIDDPALRESFQHAALASVPGSGRGGAPRASQARAGGLSRREAQVAALVARGCTNREIATTLVVSERTAEAHVSNILAKLGLTSRAHVAAWAVEHGLTEP